MFICATFGFSAGIGSRVWSQTHQARVLPQWRAHRSMPVFWPLAVAWWHVAHCYGVLAYLSIWNCMERWRGVAPRHLVHHQPNVENRSWCVWWLQNSLFAPTVPTSAVFLPSREMGRSLHLSCTDTCQAFVFCGMPLCSRQRNSGGWPCLRRSSELGALHPGRNPWGSHPRVTTVISYFTHVVNPCNTHSRLTFLWLWFSGMFYTNFGIFAKFHCKFTSFMLVTWLGHI